MNETAGQWRRRNPRMSHSRGRLVGAWCVALLIVLCTAEFAVAQRASAPQPWISTWAASPQSAMGGGGTAIDGQTIRQRMRVTVGGDRLRVHFSNAFGKNPLVIGHATVGVPTDPASVKAGSIREVTFGGRRSVTIPPGAPAVSDPVAIDVPAGSLVTVSFYLPEKPDAYTVHSLGLRTAIITPKGDFTDQATVSEASKSDSIYFVMGLSVPKKGDAFTIVAFGDSITDGTNSTVEADASWPANFARRLAAAGKANTIAIVNQGIGGNQLRRDFAGVSAQARFDRDALAIPGVKYIVLLEGINDLGFPGARMGQQLLAPADAMPTADDIIAAYQQLIARAHVHGIKIYGATLTPFKGTDLPGYYAESKEPVREKINEWIRTSGAFDAVIDFDAVLRDTEDPHRAATPLISPRDHLHPSDAGYKKMADSIDLSLFK